MKTEIAELKERKKRFERSRDDYDHAMSKYMSKKQKDVGIFESAQDVADAKREYHKNSLLYCIKLNEIIEKKKTTFLENVKKIIIYRCWATCIRILHFFISFMII